MSPSKFIRLTVATLPFFALPAQAADFSFDGKLTYNTDAVKVAFRLEQDSGNMRSWTDSRQGGLNFDPNLASLLAGMGLVAAVTRRRLSQ